MQKNKLRGMIMCALFGALICICAPWAIPFTVPITLATFAIYVTAAVLGVRRGVPAVLLYIAIGAVGVPVFSGFRGGIASLAGPTGGFIIGYIPCALICALAADLWSGRRGAAVANAVGMTVGTAVLYAVGTAWYMFTADAGFGAAAAVCVLPFLAGDAVKIAAASVLAVSLRKRLGRIGI